MSVNDLNLESGNRIVRIWSLILYKKASTHEKNRYRLYLIRLKKSDVLAEVKEEIKTKITIQMWIKIFDFIALFTSISTFDKIS